ncbi:MAG: pitrilysin family protein [Dehalococcoidia bacterium]
MREARGSDRMATISESTKIVRKTPAAGDILPFEAVEATLPNGLRVIVVPTGFPNLVSLQIPVQTGSRNEVEEGLSGFAHFFEHMMFRGTERFSPEAYQQIVSRTGARQNAYTTDDYTNYHLTFAAEDLETILEIEADRFMHLSYPEEAFKTEAKAVLGEYNKNSAEPLQQLFEVQHDHAFNTHTYKHTTMGFLRDIEDMPNQFDYSREFFRRWYRPEYTTVIVAGDVEPERVLAQVEKYWGGWERGSYTVEIPAEPPPRAAVVAHVPWPTSTLPWVTVAFHGPAFSETDKDYVAIDTLLDLQFGETSDVYRRLVEAEQKVDALDAYSPPRADPALVMVLARVKHPDDVPYVRDVIVEAVAEARRRPVDAARLDEAKSHARYGFARTLDNSESIAATLATFVQYRRAFDTVNAAFRLQAALTPEDLHAAARKYLTDANMVLTTLSHEEPPPAMREAPSVERAEASAAEQPAGVPAVIQRSPSGLLRMKFLFGAGSAHDPAGKEGLAALTASMIAEAGSKSRRIDEISRALFPIAGSLRPQTDREMTVFTGVTHRDNLDRFAEVALEQLFDPGWREEDFTRLKERQLNELVQDLRANNEEELGKERLQTNIFAGSAYGHTTLGTIAGIESLTLDDVRGFAARCYTRASLTLGLAGDVPDPFVERLQRDIASLPGGEALAAPDVRARKPSGLEVEIVEKDTRATAISFGQPVDVTRSHDDFAALWLARAWLGDHRASHGRLFQRLREVRGLNYGDYAYVEAFPRGMYQFFPDANIARRAQIFEVWIRPVMPEHGIFALKGALHELEAMVERGLDAEAFEGTRNYLMKNVYVMTKTQDQQLGYALDSRWYGIGEYTAHIRARLEALTLDAVNAAVRRHISPRDLSVVVITKDAAAYRDALLAGEFTPIEYESPKPQDILDEDRTIGARRLGVRPDAVRITPVEDVFA